MPSITLTDDQVVDLVNQLPAQQKRAVLFVLARSAQARRDERLAHAEAQLRQRAADRGRDWESLSEDEREAFIDALLHEAS